MECQQLIGKHWKKMSDIRVLVLSCSLVLFLFTACTNKYCDLITESIENQCVSEKEECSVSFEDAFDLDWDVLYIFDSMLYPEEVTKALGVNYNGKIVNEGKSLFVFMRNGIIVKKQQERCSDITFVNMKKDGIVKIRSEITYIMKRKKLNDKKHYLLFEQ